MKFLGRLVGKKEVIKEDIKDKVGATIDNTKEKWGNFKQDTSNKLNAAADKFSKAANNAAHPIDYAKLRYEEGKQEVLKQREEEKIRERLNRELNSQSIRMQEEANNRRKMMAGVAMAAPEAAPVVEMINKHDDDKDEKKLQKKEGKLIDKENKELNKSDNENKKFMDRFDDLRSGPKSSDRGFLSLLTILSIVAFVLDTNILSIIFGGSSAGFIRDGNTFLWPPAHVFVIYLLVLIVGLILVFKDGSERKNFIVATLASATLIPFLIHVLLSVFEGQEWVKVLLGIAVFFPVLPLYLMSKFPDNSGWHQSAKAWIVIWIILSMFSLMTNPYYREQTTILKGTVVTPADAAGYFVKGLFNSVGKGAEAIWKSYDRMVKDATGQSYEGEEEEQRGILIDNVRSVEKNYYTSSDIYVQANIKSQNLLGEVGVRTRCYVKDRGNGTTFPEVLTMVNNDENIIDCHLGQLPKGNYQIFVTATFIFITDADIQYYFVDEKTRPELYKSMKIPDKSVATYTGGPVMVGLPSLNQPLRISADGSNKNVGNYPFGVSLTNSWSQGKVNRGINYTLEVPRGFELLECNRKNQRTIGGTQEGRIAYLFDTNDQNIKETFDSVTCRMHVTNPSVVFNGDLVAIKTFNARAVYEYTVEGSTNINVQQDFYGAQTQTN